MFPAYSYMDSYPQPHPYQRCHIPCYPNNHHPSWEAKPEQVPATYGPWSYAGSYGYPSSVQCHGYCNQMYHPGYFPVRPPHSHLPPPSPLYHHGPFSPCEVYPPYHVPPHYSMEQPRYEYDKDMNGRHCCGCSNHACKQKEDKGVKIEEHELETKEIGSLAPPNLERKHPYPFVWLPPEYLKNNSAKQVGDEKGNESQNDEDKKPQFPFPVYWLPAIDKLEESTNKDLKESNTSPKVEEQPVKFKIIPVTSPGNNGCDVMEDADRDRVLAKRAENDAKAKTIPVEPIGESGKNKPAENEKKSKEVHVKQVEESEKKSSDNNLKNQSSSPRKATKLPPVCLRVDPLPRKRSGNGTSRSPSPPGVKSNTNQNSDGTKSIAILLERKESSGPAEQASLQNKVEEEQPKKEIKVVDVKENVNGCKEEVSMSCDQSQSRTVTPDLCNSEISRIPTTVKENISETQGIGRTFMEEGREKKELSDTEAAVLIQSFYRGFEARKWEPLKKLKQIANLREQANQVRERIQTLKSPTELQNGEKQKVLIGETIMSLLLQLDTIQGLHPTVRDIRKSVARELVCLQERLDSLGCQTTNDKEKSEVTNSSGTSLQEASHETTFDSGCMSPDPNDKPKEIDQLSVEEVKGSTELRTEINPKDESHPTLPSLSDKDELTFEAMEGAEEGNEASGPPDSIEILPVTDKKTKMETESLRKPVSEVMSPEHQSTDVACDMDHGSEPVVGCSPEQFPQGVPDEMPPSIDDNQVLLLGKQKDSLLEAVVNEKTPVDLQNPELAVGKGDFELRDEGFNDVREDILTSQMVEEKQEDAEYMTEVNEKVPSDLEKAELALGNDDNGLDHMKDDVLAPKRVEEKHEDADCATEIVNKKPPLLDMAEAMNEKPSFDSENAGPVLVKDDFLASPMGMVVEKHNKAVDVVASSTVEDEHIEDAVEVSQNELEQESTKISDSESTAEIPENGIHFHGKDVISECASLTGIDRPNEELKDSGLTKYVEQEVPVKEELTLKSQEREAADDKGLLEENEKLREVIGKLIQEGKQQLTVISNLNGRLKELERKLAKKKKLKMRRHKAPACKKLDNKCAV